VTQAISQRFHHVRREMWRLLNEKMEPPSMRVNTSSPAETERRPESTNPE
jgi:hypothetical protein